MPVINRKYEIKDYDNVISFLTAIQNHIKSNQNYKILAADNPFQGLVCYVDYRNKIEWRVKMRKIRIAPLFIKQYFESGTGREKIIKELEK